VEDDCTGHYFAVSKRKLAIMVIGTLGLYGVYWSYRQWKAYTHNTGGTQWAWARAFFYRLFACNLFEKLDGELRKTGTSINWSPQWSGCTLIMVEVLSLLSMLLNPLHALLLSILLWVITAAMFVRALPVANTLANDPQGKSNDELTGTNVAWLMFGAVWWILAIWGAWITLMYPDALM